MNKSFIFYNLFNKRNILLFLKNLLRVVESMSSIVENFIKESEKDNPSISVYLPFPFDLSSFIPEETSFVNLFSELKDKEEDLAKIISVLFGQCDFRIITINFSDPIQVRFAAKLILVVGFYGIEESRLLYLKNQFCEGISKAIANGAQIPSKRVLTLVEMAKSFEIKEAIDFINSVKNNNEFLKWLDQLPLSILEFVYFINSKRTTITKIPITCSCFDFWLNVFISKATTFVNQETSFNWSIDSLEFNNADPTIQRFIDIPDVWDLKKPFLTGSIYLYRYNPTTFLFDQLAMIKLTQDNVTNNRFQKLFLFEKPNVGKEEGSSVLQSSLVFPKDFELVKAFSTKSLKTFSFDQIKSNPFLLNELPLIKPIKRFNVQFIVPLF